MLEVATEVIFCREFQGWYRNVQSFLAWAQDYLPTKVISLANHNFRKKVLSSREPWIIDFYANWCGPCQQFASEYEKVAEVRLFVVSVKLYSLHYVIGNRYKTV